MKRKIMKINSENKTNLKISPKKRFFFTLFSIFLAVILVFILGEIILRIIPIPGIQTDNVILDPLVGFGLHPHSKTTYRSDRGDFVEKKANSWGYLDVEHEKEKKKGIYRISFFGDSYVEARQVALEETFFRIIEKKLKNYNVECIAIGNTGFSTLQSYLNSKRWADFFDVDLVVYVFCENDLGDQIKEIKKSPLVPYAVLTGNDFQIDNSFRGRNSYKKEIYFKIRNFLKTHSLLVVTLYERMKLLTQYGVKIKTDEKDRLMATGPEDKSIVNRVPEQNDLPSTWPDSWREYATELDSAVISKWNEEVKEQSRKFAILYVPRPSEIEKETKNQDSWKLWLESLCKKYDIIFIDPTDDLLETKLSGKDIFYDHFTKEGHEAFADAFVKWFIENSKN